jgi:hypothetical protein
MDLMRFSARYRAYVIAPSRGERHARYTQRILPSKGGKCAGLGRNNVRTLEAKLARHCGGLPQVSSIKTNLRPAFIRSTAAINDLSKNSPIRTLGFAGALRNSYAMDRASCLADLFWRFSERRNSDFACALFGTPWRVVGSLERR